MVGGTWGSLGSLGVMLARTRLNRHARAVALVMALFAIAVSLAACGRNGSPEPPPGPMFGADPPPATPAAAVAPAAGGPGPFIATPAPAVLPPDRRASARHRAVDALNSRACITLPIAMAYCTPRMSI